MQLLVVCLSLPFLVCLLTVVDGAGPPSNVWYCSKAEFCNWTNNPSMVTKTWWHKEYEVTFPVSGWTASDTGIDTGIDTDTLHA